MNNSQTIPTTTLTRQEFLKLSGLGLVGTTLLGTLGCGGGGGSAPEEGLLFTSQGGAYQKAQTNAWLKPYSKQSGTKIRQDSPTNYAEIQSMVDRKSVV